MRTPNIASGCTSHPAGRELVASPHVGFDVVRGLSPACSTRGTRRTAHAFALRRRRCEEGRDDADSTCGSSRSTRVHCESNRSLPDAVRLLMGSSHTKLRWCVWAGVSRQTGCVRLHALRHRPRLSTHAFLSAVPSAIVTRWPALIEAHSSHMRTTGVRSTRCGDLVRPSAPRVNTPVVP